MTLVEHWTFYDPSFILASRSHEFFLFFFFNDTATTEIYTLSLHDALPILVDAAPLQPARRGVGEHGSLFGGWEFGRAYACGPSAALPSPAPPPAPDRKSVV